MFSLDCFKWICLFDTGTKLLLPSRKASFRCSSFFYANTRRRNKLFVQNRSLKKKSPYHLLLPWFFKERKDSARTSSIFHPNRRVHRIILYGTKTPVPFRKGWRPDYFRFQTQFTSDQNRKRIIGTKLWNRAHIPVRYEISEILRIFCFAFHKEMNAMMRLNYPTTSSSSDRKSSENVFGQKKVHGFIPQKCQPGSIASGYHLWNSKKDIAEMTFRQPESVGVPLLFPSVITGKFSHIQWDSLEAT